MDLESIDQASEEKDISFLNLDLIRKQQKVLSVKLNKFHHYTQLFGSMANELMN